ncbi:MAG: hypothetical protein AAF556_00455, partial [Pseudomonadota bacterium]
MSDPIETSDQPGTPEGLSSDGLMPDRRWRFGLEGADGLVIDLGRWRWHQRLEKLDFSSVGDGEPVGQIPGNMVGLYTRILEVSDVDDGYTSDPRFLKLAADPAHNDQIRPHSIQEAMAALAAERA